MIVCDIDGTVADCSHRLHFIQQEKKDWPSFFAPENVFLDTPIMPVLHLVELLSTVHEIVFVTGRPERNREPTLLWLREFADLYPYAEHVIYMRKDRDYRPDTQVKAELIKQVGSPSQIDFILEDRASVVRMYRELGYKVLQVAEGDY